jgi:two-component system chemotaxis response regulator CheB
VREAENGDRVRPGLALIASGDFHLRLAGTPDDLRVTTDKGTPENFCRPAVDVLFRSVVDTVGSHVLGVVLTGMGSDGLRGARRIVESGGEVFAQDQATSVVWGMPGVVAQAGLASQVLPLPAVAPAVVKRLAVARTPADRLVRGRGRGAP